MLEQNVLVVQFLLSFMQENVKFKVNDFGATGEERLDMVDCGAAQLHSSQFECL